jgi:hypothetical protein
MKENSMALFLRFMGWFILYSLIYFAVLDVRGLPPADASLMFTLVIALIALPAWWATWKWFEKLFGPHAPVALGGGKTAYAFSLRNPALMYYLMVLKLFLLAMGANGIITLDRYEGGLRTFYVWNFIILYIYAIPFFIIKAIKLKKSLGYRLVVDDTRLSLQHSGVPVAEIAFDAIDTIAVEEAVTGMLVGDGATRIYIGGHKAKSSSFYLEGAENIYAKLKSAAGKKMQPVESIKKTMQEAAFKPAL